MTEQPSVERGPVQILCREIGFRFERRMETTALFIAFVAALVEVIEEMREGQVRLSFLLKPHLGAPPTYPAPSDNSGEVMSRVKTLLADAPTHIIAAAAEVHNFIHEVMPEDTYPTDHYIDMLSSCVSALRFGLERPCNSRHAAEAANHIWGRRYGVSLFDSFTPSWQKEWARAQLQAAMLNLISPQTVGGDQTKEEEHRPVSNNNTSPTGRAGE